MKVPWRIHTLSGVIHLVGILLLLVVQTSVMSHFPLFGVYPDLILVAVVSIGFLRGPVSGAGFGAAGGLLADILTGQLIGLGAMISCGVGLACGAIGSRLFGEKLLFPTLFSVPATLVHLVLYGAGAWAFGIHMPIAEGVATMGPPLIVYNALMIVIVHPILRQIGRAHV